MDQEKKLEELEVAAKEQDEIETEDTSLVAQMVKHLPTMWETWVPSLDQEDTLEKEMATHSNSLAWENPMDRGTWLATVHGVTKSWTPLSN